MTVELPVKPRVLNDRLPLPGAGLAVKPVAFWVTASMILCWPRSAMVSAVIVSTLAGVCNGVRPSRLPIDAGAFRSSAGDGCAGGDEAATVGADDGEGAVAAGFARFRRDLVEESEGRLSARCLA